MRIQMTVLIAVLLLAGLGLNHWGQDRELPPTEKQENQKEEKPSPKDKKPVKVPDRPIVVTYYYTIDEGETITVTGIASGAEWTVTYYNESNQVADTAANTTPLTYYVKRANDGDPITITETAPSCGLFGKGTCCPFTKIIIAVAIIILLLLIIFGLLKRKRPAS